MKTKTIILDGEHITVTKHTHDDYNISFERDDFSVRGSALDIIRSFAEWQQGRLDEPVVSFEWRDMSISNPWIDPSARFPLDNQRSALTYGVDNLLRFIRDAGELLRPDDEREEA